MKVFLVLPLLFLLFGSSKESILPHKRSIRGFNTTLQTNFNGTYQRKNPCTNANIELSSYVASHEFHHHIKEDNWSDYTHKCSAIISSFLQGIGNLVRFNSKQNGTFNFHINTSISQKQDGHCISPDKKECNSLPTIIIEASSCELPPPCKSSSDTEEHNERVQIATHENTNLSSQDDETLKEIRRNSAKIIPKTFTTLKPKEKKNFDLENYSTTPQCSTEAASETHTVNEGLDTEGKLHKDQKPISINDGSKNKNFIPISGYSESSSQGKIEETKDSSGGFSDDFLQNIQVTQPKQNFEFIETSKSGRNFITSITKQPEDEYTTACTDERTITDYETLPRKVDQQNTFGSENSEYITSPLSPVTWQGFTEENSFTTPGTLSFPYYPSQTDSEFESTPQPTFVEYENQYPPSHISEKQMFDALGEEIPNFQFNKTLPSTISPVITLPSNLESKPGQFERPSKYQQLIPVGLEEAAERLKLDFRAPASFDKKITSPSSERFQSAELLSDLKASPKPRIPNPKQIRQFASEADKFRLRQQSQSIRGIADMNINTTPNPTFSTPDQRNEEMPEIKNTFSSGSNSRVSFSTHSNQPESSSHLSQTSVNEEYDEPKTKFPEVANFYPSTKQTTISQVKTSQANAYSDFGAEDSLKPTTPIADYSDEQQRGIPTTPLPFLKDFADRRTDDEVTYLPESDQETEISHTDGYYHRPTTHLFTPTEENYKPSPGPSDNSFTKQAYFRSSPRSLPDYDKQNLNENINEPIRSLDQQPLKVSTSRYSDPPKMHSTAAPKIEFAESLTSRSKTDQQSADFRVSQKPYSDSEITFRENTIPPKYTSPPQSEFYDDQSESEFTKNLPSEFFPTTPSIEYLTTPSNQIPPPPVLFSGTPDNQQSYKNVHSNDFQPKPEPSLTNETPFYIQSSHRPNAQTFSGDYVTTSPRDSFLQKPELSTVAYTEKKIDRNLDLRYSDQVTTNPVPTLYSESETSNDYTTLNDYQDSSFFEPKVQSFNDIYAPALKEPFPSTEKFPDPLIKYSTELRKTTPGFENDSPINPNEQPSSYPDVYSTTPLPKASDTDLLEKTFDDFYSPVTKEPHKDKKISLKLSFEKSSADKPSNEYITAPPSPENFAIYDFQSPDESSKFQDATDDGEPESTTDEEFFIKNQSSPPSLLENDESFLNVETTPNYKSSEYTEQVSFNDYEKSDFDPLLVPTSAKQNFNTEFEEFESLITPLPPVTYPEDDFYSSDNLPALLNPPTFDEPRRQIQNEAFEPITYAEASLQSSAEAYENQNSQPVFNPNTDHSEQYSSVSSASLNKKTSSVDSTPKNINDQSSEFLTSSDGQVTDSIAGFQQPQVNYMKGYRSGLNDAKTDQLSSGIKGSGQQPFVDPEKTTFFEPEYQPTAKPAAESEKSGFSNFKNSDRLVIPNSEDYSDDFLPPIQSSETLGFSKAQAQSFLGYSDVQPDLDIQSESIISNGNNQRTTDSQSEVNLPFWTDRPADLIDPQPLTVTNSTVVNISNASPDSQSTQSLSSKTLYQENIFDSSFTSQPDLKLLNEFPSTVSPSQSIRTAGYPTSQLQPPIDYYDEEVSDPHLQQSIVSLDITSVPQAQSKEWSDINYLPTPAISYEDSTPAEEPFANDSTTPPTPQTSSHLKSQEILNYSPTFALEPEPQPQPSYDKFSDISGDNTPFLASRTFENPKITNQYAVTSFQNYLDTQEASGFRESPSPKFNEPTTAVSYIPKKQLSDDLVTTPTPFSVTDIPSFQLSLGSDLKSEELITNSNEHSQENTGTQEALILVDNTSPQPQPATAVKYDEETIQYQTSSPGPNPQPQTTLNYADQLSDDNSNGQLSEFFTNQQRLVTSDPIFYPKATSAEQTAVVHTSKSLFQSKDEVTEELSTIPSRDKDLQQTKKTFEQEIITIDYPIEVTSRPPNYRNPDSRGSFLPYNNQPHSQPVHQKPSSREQKLLISSSTGFPQRSIEYFKDETLRPPQLSDSEVNYEKEQKRDPPQIRQSNEHFESFIPYNEPPSVVSRIPYDISKPHAPPRVQTNPPRDYRNDFDDYDWMTRSSDLVPGHPRPLTPNSQVPPERFFYPNRNLNYNSRELLRPSPQELSRRFSRPKEAEFTPGFPRSFEPRRSFSPMSQLSNFPKTETREITTDSDASSYNPHVQPPSLASSNDVKGTTTTTKVVEETITTELPTAITESPIQKQLAYADRILNNNKGIRDTQPLSSSLKENRRRFPPSETLDQTLYRPPIPEYESRTFHQHSRNNPQQVEPFFEEGFSPSVSYPDYPQRRPRIDPAFPEQDYAEYHQVFPNPPPKQKFEFDEVIPQESQRMGNRYQLFDRRGTEERPYFQERPSQRPVNYTPDRKPLEFPPTRAEKQQYSNPLFHTLESQMTLPLQEPPPSATPNESFLFEPNHQKNFQDNSPSSHGWELPNAPSPHQQGITKSHQSESQVVPDLTDPSNNPGEDHVSRCKHDNRVATTSPLLCPFDPILKGNMTAPSYYILISKLPADDNGDEQFQVEKVYLGDGTPLKCFFSSGKTFTTSLYTSVPFLAAGRVKFQTKSDVA